MLNAKSYTLLIVLTLLPIVFLSWYAHHIASSGMDAMIRAGNRAAATVTRGLIEHHFANGVATLQGVSQNPHFIAEVSRQDATAARERLRVLVETQPRVVRSFITDPAGNLWSDFPYAPESIGENFSHRDWFKGVSSGWMPYVSNVYRRHAAPPVLLVAIAVPVYSLEGGGVIGIIVNQVLLEDISELLGQVTVGSNGHVMMLDGSGRVAAHPKLMLQEREYDEYVSLLPELLRIDREPVEKEHLDPHTNETMLATAMTCRMPGGRRWVVIAQQPAAVAFAPVRAMGYQIGIAGVLFAVITGGMYMSITRYHDRVRRLNMRLREVNDALTQENHDRLAAEQQLRTANDHLEERVRERTQQLQLVDEQLNQSRKMEAVGKLAGGIAHDFNNLLTVITGYAELILDRMPQADPLRHPIAEMQDAGNRAATLVKQLLAFSRKQVMQPEVFDINATVREMESMLRRLIGENIDLVTKTKPDLLPVKMDPGQFEQIIMNLVINARDAMPDGGKLTIETANVTLSPEYVQSHAEARPGPHVMLAVTDTGVGMDEQTRTRVFEPFFTTKKLGRGTGLGLSTVYGIVKQSGGNIWLYSEPGIGTTFKVYLPCTDETPAEAQAARETSSHTGGTETILVVEDEEGVRSLIRGVLQGAGYTVLDTGDVDEALAICADTSRVVHLVLTDVVMPKMGGKPMADRILQMRPAIKVVFMSGYTDNAIVHHGVLDPGTAFIEKPISPHVLLERLRHHLG